MLGSLRAEEMTAEIAETNKFINLKPIKSMKANKKTFVGILAGLALTTVAAIAIKRATRREEKRLVEMKKQEDQDIKDLGVSPERMRSQVIECEREADKNMVKAMFVGIESNPDWDKDVIDIDRALSSKSMLHITEDTGNRGIKYLNFLFEIPDLSGTKGYNDPRIGDYYVSMKQLKEYLWSRVVTYCKEPRGYMAVYLAYSYKNPNKKSEKDHSLISEVLEIPRSVWSKWADEHDGVVEFFNDAEENGILPACQKKHVWEEVCDVLTKDIISKNPDIENLDTISPRPEELRLMYKISFREAERAGDFGIDVKTALNCLKYIYEDFSVTRKDSEKGGVRFDNFMFHAPNDEGTFDSLTRYYTTKNGEVVHDSYSYPDDDEEEVDYSKTNNVFNAAKYAALEKRSMK